MTTKWSVFLLAVLLTGCIPHGGKKAERAEAEKYIRQSESDWAEESVSNDPEILRRILADDYLGVSSSSQVVNKQDQIAEALAARKPGDFLSNKVNHVDIHFFSDKLAIAQGSESWEKRDGTSGRYIWVDTWLRRHGKWQIIASQDTQLPAE